jgi:hypothetical protein
VVTYVVTYVTFFPTSRLDPQAGYVLTIISIRVVWAATRARNWGSGVTLLEMTRQDKLPGLCQFPGIPADMLDGEKA